MLTLTFLGVGSAFAKRNFQSSALLEAWRLGPRQQSAPDDLLLIDFGTTGSLALHNLKDVVGFTYLAKNGAAHYPSIKRIFVTHLHSDHIGGLEEFAFMTRYQADDDGIPEWKPQLFAAEAVLRDLWDRSLRGGLEAMGGRRMNLNDYFSPKAMDADGDARGLLLLDRYEIQLFPTDHVQISRKYDWPSFGLLLVDKETSQSAVYSGDTRFNPDDMGSMMAAATTIFHDVQLHEHYGNVHALLHELQTLPTTVRRKMFLYHYGDSWDSESFDHVATEFCGFAQAQRRYVLFE